MYQKTLYSIIGLAAAFVMLAACAKEVSPTVEEPILTYQDKFVNTKAGADTKTILFQAEGEIGEDFAVKGLSNVRKLFAGYPEMREIEAELGMDKWYEADVEGSIDEVSTTLAKLDCISRVEFNTKLNRSNDGGIVGTAETKADEDAIFNDPSLGAQWGLINKGDKSIATASVAGADINVKDVWRELTTGDPSIIIAICDEGVKYSHEDLKDNMWTNTAELNGVKGVDDDGNGIVDDIYGAKFVNSSKPSGEITWNNTQDSGHGTHCAGIAAAVNNNGKGVCGVAGGSGKGDGCRIMSCQIFDGNSGGTVSTAAKAFEYAAAKGASVLSCSFGYTAGVFTTDNQYENAAKAEVLALRAFESDKRVIPGNPVIKGGIAIFAAGNDANNYATYPGALNDIICVSATGPDGLPAYYTNYGPGCNIAAPGGEAGQLPFYNYKALILSTVPNEVASIGEKQSGYYHYGYMQGTSMACPYVSGITALGLSYAKKLGKTFEQKKFKEMIVTSANDIDTRINAAGKKTLATGDLNLGPYKHNMGTGTIDSWLLMMKIEGIPSIIAEIGSERWYSMDNFFGTSSSTLTYLNVEISPEDKAAIGLAEDPKIQYGKLYLHPTKPGSCKIKVNAVGGGDALGGGDKPTGGMAVSQEISIVARYATKAYNGGWL